MAWINCSPTPRLNLDRGAGEMEFNVNRTLVIQGGCNWIL